MTTSKRIIGEMMSLFDESQARHLARFFKTGEGDYGEGDKFLGIKVPVTRSIVKKFSKEISLPDIKNLIDSEWHEIRLAGFLLLLELYKKSLKDQKYLEAKQTIDHYLINISKGNNWDLVDLIAPNLLGDWLLRQQDCKKNIDISKVLENAKLLYEIADRKETLWHERVSIVATFALIKEGIFEPTFIIAQKLISHPHDLIHKATGWMLREIGKRDGKTELVNFLNRYKTIMPRTMLRYAIEKFSDEERKYFMRKF